MMAHVAQSTAQQAIAMQNQTEPSDYEETAPKQPLVAPQSAVEPSNASPPSTAGSSSTQNRKRKHTEEDDGPPSRRTSTSFQRGSPSSNIGAGGAAQGPGFMPVNTGSSYASLSSPPHTLPPGTTSTLNGVSQVEHQLSQMGAMIPGMGISQQHMTGEHLDPSFGLIDAQGHSSAPTGPAPLPPRPSHPAPITKPQVGSEEWHRVRKDNHKEVERRRRETINEGINELAKIVPGCEKNKGSILQRTVQYINELKEELKKVNNDRGVEKMLTDQAMRDLTNVNDKLKAECERAWREAETWKKVVSSAENSSSNAANAGSTTAKS
ncbi:basic helix-loop-helix protein [Arthrobotrys musiformis]|uniref:Basic helix-loop-helix protein n=1 Tax=Arthrobotrys musiformis TaxID=47236 RepID=A0AAV9VU89_9PEZI